MDPQLSPLVIEPTQQRLKSRAGFTQHHFFRSVTSWLTSRYQRKSGAGFTLIELLVVAALFAVAFLLATTVFARVQSSQRGIAGRQQQVADGRYLLEAMARTVRLGSVDYRYYTDPDNDITTTTSIDLSLPQSILAVRDPQGNQTCYWWPGTGSALRTISNTNDCGGGTSGAGTPITPQDVVVTKFQVIIRPVSDPFLGTRTSLDCKVAVTADGACPCNDATDGVDNDTDNASCLLQQRCATQRPQDPISPTNPEICLNVNVQPTVTLVLETQSSQIRSGEQSNIALQTTVTPRTLRR